ncbi:MAG TPA: hypothetical protein DDW55_12970, partial [Gammaproteobacteria bacterium]|nr:hypothetical protein [Gammaproteobacteria bacterium]
MTRHHKQKSPARLLRSLYIWHRYIGISTAVFVIVLTFTGLMLNHTDELELDSSYIQSDLLLDWYGIDSSGELTSYTSGTVSVTEVSGRVFWGNEPLSHVSAPLTGLLVYRELVVIAAGGVLSLYTIDGELIEKLEHVAGVPAGILAVGITTQELLAVKTAQGIYLTDDSMLEWRRVDNPEVLWSVASPVPDGLKEPLQATYRGIGLPVERVLLDLHSGRIFGRAGVYLVDAAAILFLLLAVSGV